MLTGCLQSVSPVLSLSFWLVFPHNRLRCYLKYSGAIDYRLQKILILKQYDSWKSGDKTVGQNTSQKLSENTGETLIKHPASALTLYWEVLFIKLLLQTTATSPHQCRKMWHLFWIVVLLSSTRAQLSPASVGIVSVRKLLMYVDHLLHHEKVLALTQKICISNQFC